MLGVDLAAAASSITRSVFRSFGFMWYGQVNLIFKTPHEYAAIALR